jgi:hypothetical protein
MMTRHPDVDAVGKIIDSPMAAGTPPATSAARMRRLRERREKGTVLVVVPVLGSGIRLLVELGWLDANSRADRKAVRGALSRLANRALALRTRPGG